MPWVTYYTCDVCNAKIEDKAEIDERRSRYPQWSNLNHAMYNLPAWVQRYGGKEHSPSTN